MTPVPHVEHSLGATKSCLGLPETCMKCVQVMPCATLGNQALLPVPAPHSHITLGGIDTVVQGLNGHPAHREPPLGESEFKGLGEEEGPV